MFRFIAANSAAKSHRPATRQKRSHFHPLLVTTRRAVQMDASSCGLRSAVSVPTPPPKKKQKRTAPQILSTDNLCTAESLRTAKRHQLVYLILIRAQGFDLGRGRASASFRQDFSFQHGGHVVKETGRLRGKKWRRDSSFPSCTLALVLLRDFISFHFFLRRLSRLLQLMKTNEKKMKFKLGEKK